jgi:hypothetical protein
MLLPIAIHHDVDTIEKLELLTRAELMQVHAPEFKTMSLINFLFFIRKNK